MSRADERDAGIERQVLDPLDRAAEFLFGLVMALTFTCTLSVATSEQGAALSVALGALACNVAWGIVDAVMYLLSCLAQRGRSLAALRRLRRAQTLDAARNYIRSRERCDDSWKQPWSLCPATFVCSDSLSKLSR